MKFAEIKKFLIFDLIGCLIVAALVAVATVLFGKFDEVTTRVFFTLFMAITHSLISLAFVWDDSGKNGLDSLKFFVNTIFIIIVLSFVTSIFGIWKIVSAENIWRIYETYFYVGFASLHANILFKAMGKEKYMDNVIYANYAFIAGVVLLLQPIIYTTNAIRVLPEMYFRWLGAIAIIDATLSILTIIFYKLYINKHPEARVPAVSRRGFSIWLWLLIIFLIYQLFAIVFRFFVFGFWR